MDPVREERRISRTKSKRDNMKFQLDLVEKNLVELKNRYEEIKTAYESMSTFFELLLKTHKKIEDEYVRMSPMDGRSFYSENSIPSRIEPLPIYSEEKKEIITPKEETVQ